MVKASIFLENPQSFQTNITNRNPCDGQFPLEDIMFDDMGKQGCPVKFSSKVTSEYIQNYINTRARPHFSLVHMVRLLNAVLATAFTMEYKKTYGAEGSYLVYESTSNHFRECFFSNGPMINRPLPNNAMLADSLYLYFLCEEESRVLPLTTDIKAWRHLTIEFVAKQHASENHVLISKLTLTAFITVKFLM